VYRIASNANDRRVKPAWDPCDHMLALDPLTLPRPHASHALGPCAITPRMASLIVTLLAERPTEELEALRDKARAERARVDVELQQFEEALALKARRSPRPTSRTPGRSARPGATQKRIIDAVASFERAVSPAEIIAEMESHGATPSKGSIHNTIGRLVKNGVLTRLGEGQYQLASRNGSSAESRPGPTENEATEPLSTATGPQEGT
jgi:hypothetical protein